ncbi:MAG: type III-B CRISPR module-associated protein Cmr3 [Kiritimatiellaeota bacterium]|nr:type III-B CRISPR module-associated protein Cmr3 [Kiritimatiellota bacterium]
MKTFEIIPRDILFLGDARAMSARDVGRGANWPRPDQLNAALHHAFRQAAPHHFGGLKTFGPFPRAAGGLCLPCPLDWDMGLVPCGGLDLPAPLTRAFASKRKGAAALPQWISQADYAKYLNGEDAGQPAPCAVFDVERNTGVIIDELTEKVEAGNTYQAEYLRLREGVTLAFAAEYKDDGHHERFADVFERLLATRTFILGGQQGVVCVREAAPFAIPRPAALSTPYLRWTLLTPALFAGGWLPGWCRDTKGNAPLGTVMFRDYSFARLVAARVGKPLAFSGWDPVANQPKPTSLAVPAGSSYVFDCGSVEDARKLAERLDYPRTLSDQYGEKGFGLGVCSSVHI